MKFRFDGAGFLCYYGCMEKIILGNEEIEYKLRRSKRAKKLRVAIYCDASVIVTMPTRANIGVVEKFLAEKADWLLDKIAFFREKTDFVTGNQREDFLRHRVDALILAEERLAYFNRIFNFTINKVNIRNQKTRWGSCSRKGNINLSYKIVLLPTYLSDYIIVHELCHLGEFNHSANFWKLVERVMPDYMERRKELKRN